MTGDDWRRLDPRVVPVSGLLMTGVAVLAGVPTAVGLADGLSWPVALAWTLPGAALVIALGVGAEWLRLRTTRFRVGPSASSCTAAC